MNNFFFSQRFATLPPCTLCPGKERPKTDDMRTAINLIKDENGRMQCAPMLQNAGEDEYKKAFPKCHREAYNEEDERTEECPY